MKSKPWYTVIAAALCCALSACGTGLKGTTDLSAIKVDGVSIGDMIAAVDLEKYTPSTRFPEKDGTYNFEELRLETVNGVIVKLTAVLADTLVTVNGKELSSQSGNIIALLGNDVKISEYDREQHLRQMRYEDGQNRLACDIIYDAAGQLVWLILEQRN